MDHLLDMYIVLLTRREEFYSVPKSNDYLYPLPTIDIIYRVYLPRDGDATARFVA